MNNHVTRRSSRRPLQSNSSIINDSNLEDDIAEVDNSQCDGAPPPCDNDTANCKLEVRQRCFKGINGKRKKIPGQGILFWIWENGIIAKIGEFCAESCEHDCTLMQDVG